MVKALKYAKYYKKELYIAMSMIFLSVIAGIIPYFLVNNLMIDLLKGNTITTVFVMKIGVLVAMLLIIKSIFNAIGLTYSHKAAYNTLFEMQKYFCEKIAKTPLGIIDKNGSGFYKKKLIDDIESLEVTFAHFFVEGIPNMLIPIVVLTILFINDWRMGLLSCASIPISVIAMNVAMKLSIGKMPKYYEVQTKLSQTIIEYISGMEVIKIFGRTATSYEKYTKDVNIYRDYSYDWAKGTWREMSIVNILLPCTIILTLPIGVLMNLQGVLSVETLVFTLLLDISIGVPIHKVVLFLPYIPQLSYAMNELENAFEEIPLKSGNIDELPITYDVAFNDVSFAYDKVSVLSKVNLCAKENTLTAIVGPSGGGKSTIVNLLVHYWDVSEGSITIGGRNINDYTSEALSNMISFVSQDNFLFNESISDNIRIAKPTATQDEIIKAAKAGACDGFIQTLKDGYDAKVGINGCKLSGGEIQRITIARAILKNTPIIIFDEAMAHVDAENELLIQEAIGNLLIDKTVIVIAHHINSVVHAGNIVVVNQGLIEGQGKHKELLESCETYKKLWLINQESLHWELEV